MRTPSALHRFFQPLELSNSQYLSSTSGYSVCYCWATLQSGGSPIEIDDNGGHDTKRVRSTTTSFSTLLPSPYSHSRRAQRLSNHCSEPSYSVQPTFGLSVLGSTRRASTRLLHDLPQYLVISMAGKSPSHGDVGVLVPLLTLFHTRFSAASPCFRPHRLHLPPSSYSLHLLSSYHSL